VGSASIWKLLQPVPGFFGKAHCGQYFRQSKAHLHFYGELRKHGDRMRSKLQPIGHLC